jgi:hypothetical protein
MTLCLAAVLGHSVQALELGRFFGDEMVLQRSTRTAIWGSGATNRMPIWVQYRRATVQTNADALGNWRIELDLSKPNFGPPDTLTIGIGKKGKGQVCALRNVAVGRVWLLTDWQSQNVPLEPVRKLIDPFSRVRYLNLANPAREPRWESFEALVKALGRNAFTVYLAHTFAQSGAVGIVQTTPQDLKNGLDAARATARLSEVAGVQVPLSLANKAVQQYESKRYEDLVNAKHDGVVREIPSAVYYELPRVYPATAFDPSRGPGVWLTFEAAIWPGPAQSQ